jgi:hypothetical protein
VRNAEKGGRCKKGRGDGHIETRLAFFIHHFLFSIPKLRKNFLKIPDKVLNIVQIKGENDDYSQLYRVQEQVEGVH